MVCVCCVEEKKTLEMLINMMQNMRNVYFGDQHSSDVEGFECREAYNWM